MRMFSLGQLDALVIGNGTVIRVLEIDGDEVHFSIERRDDDSVDFGEAHSSLHQPSAEPELV